MNKSKADSLTDVSSQISSSYETMVINLRFCKKRSESEKKLIKKRKHSVDSQNSIRTRSNSIKTTENLNKTIIKAKQPIKIKREINLNFEKSQFNATKNVWADETEVSKWTGPIKSEKVRNSQVNIKYMKPSTPTRQSRVVVKQEPDFRPPHVPQNIVRQRLYNSGLNEPIIVREKPPIPPVNPPKQVTTMPGKIITMPRKIIYESFYGRQLKNLDFRNAD